MIPTETVLINGEWRPSANQGGSFQAIDPTCGLAIGPHFPISGRADVEAALQAAVDCVPALVGAGAEQIAAFLEAYAKGIEDAADDLVALAHAETVLPISPRLAVNELPRTTNQLRQAAQAVRNYAWTQPVIDTEAGLRAHFAPLGKPVLVFGPNNFPLAFNAIAGSDFASAIAARNPVIAKVHPSHPATSRKLAQIAVAALRDSGLPAASVQMLYEVDRELGVQLCGDRRLGAIGFTGSRAAGLALKAAADRSGIAFYAEMSSVNPVFLLEAALLERGDVLAQEFFASCTLGSGQFCTSPGVIVVPQGAAGDRFVSTATALFAAGDARVLFSAGVLAHLQSSVATLRAAGASELAVGKTSDSVGYFHAPLLLSVEGAAFIAQAEALQTEAFGPVSLIVRVADIDAAAAVAAAFDGNLTGAIFAASNGDDDACWQRIAEVLRSRVGRLIDGKWPTGVAVSAAMNHGGPYPSTSHPGFTSVGMPAAIHRFAALHSYDGVADARLPRELRNANPDRIQRCIDGVWTTADAG